METNQFAMNHGYPTVTDDYPDPQEVLKIMSTETKLITPEVAEIIGTNLSTHCYLVDGSFVTLDYALPLYQVHEPESKTFADMLTNIAEDILLHDKG